MTKRNVAPVSNKRGNISILVAEETARINAQALRRIVKLNENGCNITLGTARINGYSKRTIDQRISMVKAAGYGGTLVRGYKGCTTTYYRDQDQDSQYIYFVTTDKAGKRKDGVIDVYTYEIIDGKNIYWDPRGDKKNIAFSGSKRLHKIVAKAKEGESVDHMYTSVQITTKDSVRVCESYQNRCNSTEKINQIKKHRKNEYYFTDEVVINDDIVVKSLESQGYIVKPLSKTTKGFRQYNVKSPAFDTVDEWYEAINKYENAVYGEFRYNPVKDLSNSFDLFFDCLILGKATEEEMWYIRRQALLSANANASTYLYKSVDIKKYYNL